MFARIQLPAYVAFIFSILAVPTPTRAFGDINEWLLLSDAIDVGDVKCADKMIAANPKLLDTDDRYRNIPIIHRAASKGSVEMMKLLLKHGADIKFENRFYGTALEYAAKRGSYGRDNNREAMVKLLLEHGAKLDFVSAVILDKREEVTRSLKSTQMGELNRKLLGPDRSETRMPIHWAAANGRNEMIKILHQFGASPNEKCNWGPPPLNEAIEGAYFETVKLLVELGADVDLAAQTGESPLHCAIRCTQSEIAEFLLWKMANTNTVINRPITPVSLPNGWRPSLDTPLHTAAMLDDAKMIELLVAHGAKVNVPNDAGNTPLATAREYQKPNAAAMLRKLGGTP